jgi:branched-chain amino acid transport system substrate-binding protein
MNAVQSYEPLVVWAGASSTKVEHDFGPKKWFFHLHPWDYHRQSTVTNFLKEASPRPKTIALTYEDGIYGTTSADYFKTYAREAGFEIVLDEPHKSGSADFTSLLTKAKGVNPDVFYSVSYAGDYIIQIKQAKEIGFAPKAFVIVAPMFPKYVESLGKAGDHVVGVNPWAPSLKIEGLDAWRQRLIQLYPEKASFEYWLPLGYASLMAVAEAVKKAGSTDKDQVIAALEALDLVTPFGRLQFKPSQEGGLHQAFTELVMVQWQDLKPVVVYPKDVAGAPFVYPRPQQ